MERFEDIWISTEDHLKIFREVKSQRQILKNVDKLDIGDKYYDFPRIFVSNDLFPVIFENIGRLIISDDTIQFYVSSNEDLSQYCGINKGGNLFISYNQITNIELISYKSAFISYFDNYWIKISYKENGTDKHILISNSGKGLVMRKIKRKNIELLDFIKRKINYVAK
jgi:hypothetical protein